jgi:hypothetical protein
MRSSIPIIDRKFLILDLHFINPLPSNPFKHRSGWNDLLFQSNVPVLYAESDWLLIDAYVKKPAGSPIISPTIVVSEALDW